jgi:CheY-like chemotaxis protein
LATATTDNHQTVMVVDDEKDLLMLTRSMLEKEGHKVHAFTNPTKALSHVEDGCTDCELLISDARMPGIGGFELVRRIKEMRPEMKVILMTAFKINKNEARLVLPSSKVDAFLHKPFRSSDLVEAIKQCAVSS